ncbi:MAG: redoxin domain-containing protein, partial [Planctomycetes bacterium]|nr:redoxin domain-containing protein [Planctomycetota bacterium]
MRRTILTALLAMTLLSTGAAIAQVEIGTIGKPPKDLYYWRDEKGEIRFSLKRFQGRVVVFYFWRTSRAESVDYLKTLNVLEKRMRPKGVRFISMCTDIPEVAEKFLQEKSIEVFPGDKDVYNYYGDFLRYVQTAFGSMSHPECVIVDPYSNIAWRGHPGDRLEERLDQVIEATKPLAGDPKAIEALFRKADKFMDEKDYGKAYTIARRVFMATNEDSQENTKARNVMERVEEKGGDWLKEARDIKEKDKEKAA